MKEKINKKGFTPNVKGRHALTSPIWRLSFIQQHNIFFRKNIGATEARRLHSGLTLIETLVAISVLMVAVSGALSLSYKSLSSASFAKDQITAYYLAQDGMESVKKLRDETFFSSSNWMAGFGPCGNNNKCKIDPLNLNISSCSSNICDPLNFDEATGLYSYDNSLPVSIYTREIQLIRENNHEELLVVTINWQSGGINKSFTVKETIFDWYDE